PTARNSAARSPHNDRTAATLSSPGLIVATRKIAARVSGAASGCGTALGLPAAPGVIIGSNSVAWYPSARPARYHARPTTTIWDDTGGRDRTRSHRRAVRGKCFDDLGMSWLGTKQFEVVLRGLDPRIHVFAFGHQKTWMAGTSPRLSG